ncbi:hypothetical protein B0H67DRAFT_656107, partial [Lasiosphaeris hirsuta]
MDETKCSLPSISNLLGLADQGSPTSETSPQSQQSQSSKPDTRPNSSHYGNPAVMRAALPPSPPMSSDASFEGYNSPSTKSVSQLSSTSNYYFETTPQYGMPGTWLPSPSPPRSGFGISTTVYCPDLHEPARDGVLSSHAADSSSTAQMQAASPSATCLSNRHHRLFPDASIGSLPVFGSEPVATPPLHCPFIGILIPPVPRPLHLPNLQQG